MNEIVGKTSQNKVKKNPIHIEQHQTQDRMPARTFPGIIDIFPNSSYFIPAMFVLIFKNKSNGPPSFTNMDDIRHTASA